MLIHLPKELAMLVVSQRKKLKLSQKDTGDLVGLKQQTISAFELNPEGTKINTLFRILSAVKLEIKVGSKDDSHFKKTEWKEEW